MVTPNLVPSPLYPPPQQKNLPVAPATRLDFSRVALWVLALAVLAGTLAYFLGPWKKVDNTHEKLIANSPSQEAKVDTQAAAPLVANGSGTSPQGNQDHPGTLGPKAPPIQARPAPSTEFLTKTKQFKISGVARGTPVRVILDGKMLRVGDLVDPSLGIKLTAADVENKTLTFEDPSGAQVPIRY